MIPDLFDNLCCSPRVRFVLAVPGGVVNLVLHRLGKRLVHPLFQRGDNRVRRGGKITRQRAGNRGLRPCEALVDRVLIGSGVVGFLAFRVDAFNRNPWNHSGLALIVFVWVVIYLTQRLRFEAVDVPEGGYILELRGDVRAETQRALVDSLRGILVVQARGSFDGTAQRVFFFQGPFLAIGFLMILKERLRDRTGELSSILVRSMMSAMISSASAGALST